MTSATMPRNNDEMPILRERFPFHDLQSKSGSDAEDGGDRLAHHDLRTTQVV
jgi:hypothetical protein